MAPSPHSKQPRKGLDRVRDQILTALHFGRLRPGDRAPSVRRLADLTGMNRKTVHRAYRRLATEGLLDLRPGSGTFIRETGGRSASDPSTNDLMRSLNRCRAEAARLGVAPDVFSGFLTNFMGRGLEGLPLAVVECNREQIDVIVSDLRRGLGVDPRPILLGDLARARRTLATVRGVVTTDCHCSEVSAVMEPLGLPVYRVALDPAFPQTLAYYAKQGPVVMVLRDGTFAPVFLRLLAQLAVPRDLIERFTLVELGDAGPLLERAAPDTAVFVSPLVDDAAAARLPGRLRRIQGRWHLAAGSVDRLRARLALDAAARAPAPAAVVG